MSTKIVERVVFLKNRKWTIIAVPLVFLLLFALTYIPHKVVSIDPSKVSEITVFDGNTGYNVEITDRTDINHIINNLNEVTFQKGKSIKELIINSNDTIKYKGFFYTSVSNSIDYDYIKQLVLK